MKNAAIVIFAAVLSGCAATNPLVEKSMTSTSPGIFRTATSRDTADMATVEIYASVKTHTPNYHFFERGVRGTKDYTLMLNIGGQPVQLFADPTVENTPDPGKTNPESGEGVRYLFKKTVYLKPGVHKLTIASPVDNAAVEKTLNVNSGRTIVSIEPVYNKIARNKIMHFRGERHFSQHVDDFTIKVNGKGI